MTPKPSKFLIVLTGPTGVGKTDLSIDIAQSLSTEIISCDSRQMYKEMNIGTAVPEKEYLQKVKHHFIQHLSIHDYYNASKFEYEALDKLDELYKDHDVVLMTGGSTLYIDAVCKGIDELPEIDQNIRKQLIQEFEDFGLEHLQKELKKIDPNYYQKVDLNNHSRLLRALEVQRQTGKTFSSLRKEQDKEREFTIITIVLNRDRKELYNRINTRVDLMLDAGLIKEAEKLHPFKHLVPLKTVGYRELFNYFEGNYSLQEAIEKIKSNSRHYARRQLTWFRRNKDAHWFNPGANDKIKNFINSII